MAQMAKAMSKDKITRLSTERMEREARKAQGKSLPPVHAWNPEHSGEMDMRIARDGTWYHEGTPITRHGLVKLFSTILRKDDDGYVLVTPVEEWGITVDDAPFVAIDVDRQGEGEAQVLSFETNVGDIAEAGPDNPIRVSRDEESGEPSPYVLVRDRLEALIDRKSFYRMIEMGSHKDGWFGFWSGGMFFPVIPSEEMEV